jgi:hypothetical protein
MNNWSSKQKNRRWTLPVVSVLQSQPHDSIDILNSCKLAGYGSATGPSIFRERCMHALECEGQPCYEQRLS